MYATVERHLENWATWHRHSSAKLGYPTKAMVASGGGQSISNVFEELCEDADRHAAEVMESIISDLSLDKRGAIYHKWLGCVIRVRDQAKSLAEAYDELAHKIGKRGLS